MKGASKSKVLSNGSLEGFFAQARAGGRKVAFCSGHFNVVHPGHLRFLEAARDLADLLVVGVLGSQRIPQPQRARLHPEADRAMGVAALSCVDQVIPLTTLSALDVLQRYHPEVVVMGREFRAERRHEILDQLEAISGYGGLVVYHSGESYGASAELLHSSLGELDRRNIEQFHDARARHDITVSSMLQRLDAMTRARLLVVGDSIVDQYVACDPVGMSSEAPVLVVRELETRDFMGGAAVVAAHASQLGGRCGYVSVIGNDPPAQMLRESLKTAQVDATLLIDSTRPTSVKIRYMAGNQKLFRVSRLREHPLNAEAEESLLAEVSRRLDQCHGIVICDFVYGVVTSRAVSEIRRMARAAGLRLFADLQCSSQVGNVAKFTDFDLLFPTEREARIALANHDDGIERVARKLMDATRCQGLLIKLGSAGLIAYQRELLSGQDNPMVSSEHFPALVSNPVDLAGAGDALLAAAALAVCSGASLLEAAALGTCVAALSVQRLGNIPVARSEVRDYLHQLK